MKSFKYMGTFKILEILMFWFCKNLIFQRSCGIDFMLISVQCCKAWQVLEIFYFFLHAKNTQTLRPKPQFLVKQGFYHIFDEGRFINLNCIGEDTQRTHISKHLNIIPINVNSWPIYQYWLQGDRHLSPGIAALLFQHSTAEPWTSLVHITFNKTVLQC